MSLLTAGSETFGERPRPDPASGSYRRKKHKALLFGFIISPTEDHGQNSGHKEYFISCDKQRLQIPLTQVVLKELKDLMKVAVFLSPKHMYEVAQEQNTKAQGHSRICTNTNKTRLKCV